MAKRRLDETAPRFPTQGVHSEGELDPARGLKLHVPRPERFDRDGSSR